MNRVVLVLGLCALAACNQGGAPADGPAAAPAGAPTVAFVTNNAGEFWTIAEEGTKKAAADLGVKVVFKLPATGTAQEQQQILEDLLVTGVQGVAISPVDPQNWTAVLNDFAAKVPIVTQDSDAPESNRACYIGTDNYEAGKAAGELVKQALPDGGKIMLFVGTLDAQNAQDRKRGVEDAVAGTNITILDTRTDDVDRARAVANVEDALVRNPDLAACVGLWSYNGPAILQAVTGANKLGQVKIVAFDEEPPTLQGIIDGHIEGTIVQQPYEFGYQSVRLLTELIEGNGSRIPESKQIFVPVKTITKSNVDAFWAELKRMLGQA